MWCKNPARMIQVRRRAKTFCQRTLNNKRVRKCSGELFNIYVNAHRGFFPAAFCTSFHAISGKKTYYIIIALIEGEAGRIDTVLSFITRVVFTFSQKKGIPRN
jgi:hypothetical protein